MRLNGLCLALLLVLPGITLAGGQATLRTGDGVASEILWQDAQTLRMQNAGDQDYFIVRDGKAYAVSRRGGKPMVLDMGAMLQMMRGAGRGNDQQPSFPQPGSFEATGERETVAGIEGEVYRMSWTDHTGRERTQEVVLTDRPLVVEMTRAYLGSVGAMFDGENASGFQQAMPGGHQGLLRVGEDFRLVSISGDTPGDGPFELPAEPTSLQQMMQPSRR